MKPLTPMNPLEPDPTSPEADLALRLRGPEGPQLMQHMQQRLASLDAQLKARLQQGADAASYAQLQAGLQAVGAAYNILEQLPVRSGPSTSPWVQVPSPSTRSPS